MHAGIPTAAAIRRYPPPAALAFSTAQITSAAYALRSNNDTGNNTCVTAHPRHRDRRGRTGSTSPTTRRDRAKPHPANTPSGHDGHDSSPPASRDSTRTASTSTVTISASEHYSAAPRQAGQDFSGVPCTHQFLDTLTTPTTRINPARTPPTPSADSTTKPHPVIVSPSDGQHLADKGGALCDITVGDCLELSTEVDGRSVRRNAAMGFYQLLHTMGVFGPDAPSRMRAFTTQGQLSPAQLIDRYSIECRPGRDHLVAYLQARQSALDHTSLAGLSTALAGLFWRDLERHHPGIDSLHLPPEVSAAWKQRMMIKTRQVASPDGQLTQIQQRRAGGLQNLSAVRAFYLDIAQWAMEEPGRWGPWAAPCPIRTQDLARQKELRSRKSRMDQRTRERLPVLPRLVRHVHTTHVDAAARLEAARGTESGSTFTAAGGQLRRTSVGIGSNRVWAEPVNGGKRRDLTGEETRAFWTWAAVETLRHTGIRIEELTELTHHSLIQYTVPGTGELVPLLQIAPSKSDTERLLVVSPELADVLAAIITRTRQPDGSLGCVTSYDPHERTWNPPMPLLFQRRMSLEQRAIPGGTIADWLRQALHGTGITDVGGQQLQFTPHDFRRMFITDAVLHGMPPHIAQLVAGHRDINTTMGYKAVYPEEIINGHRAFIARRRALRPAQEYRVPTEQEWDEFLAQTFRGMPT